MAETPASKKRSPEEIQADIQAIESDIVRMLAEITGSKT